VDLFLFARRWKLDLWRLHCPLETLDVDGHCLGLLLDWATPEDQLYNKR
jgi:hypothetical protein